MEIETNEPTKYEDIGHYPDHERSAIWRLSWAGEFEMEPYIESVSARKRTHEMTWGQECLRYWRGRFDTKTKQCSVIGPENFRDGRLIVAERIVALLREEFGADIEIYRFPGGVKFK